MNDKPPGETWAVVIIILLFLFILGLLAYSIIQEISPTFFDRLKVLFAANPIMMIGFLTDLLFFSAFLIALFRIARIIRNLDEELQYRKKERESKQ